LHHLFEKIVFSSLYKFCENAIRCETSRILFSLDLSFNYVLNSIKVWKLSAGDIIEYKEATCIGGFKRKGTHRIMIPLSGVIRDFRDITLFEIDGLKVY
jgi:hypothetical protein